MTTFLFIVGTIGAIFYLGFLTGIIGYKKMSKREDCCGDTKKPSATEKQLLIDPQTGEFTNLENLKLLDLIPEPGWLHHTQEEAPQAIENSILRDPEKHVIELDPAVKAAIADNLPPLEEEKQDAGLAYITHKYGENAAKHYSSGMLVEADEIIPVEEPERPVFKVIMDGERVTSVEVPTGMDPILNRREYYTQVGVRFTKNGLKLKQVVSFTQSDIRQMRPRQLVIPITEPVVE